MILDVPTAQVVVTNPTHLAIALAYAPGDIAPKLVAKGAGIVAQRIRAVAEAAQVPLRENKPLAQALFRQVEVNELIPLELYEAVAEVLAAVQLAEQKAAAQRRAQVAPSPSSPNDAASPMLREL